MSFTVCLDNNSCSGSPWFDSFVPWLGNGTYEIVPGDGDYAGENVLFFNGGFIDVAQYTLPYGDGYYYAGGCTYGCEDPASPTYHQYQCDPCGYYDCGGSIYYPANGESCNSGSQDYFGYCCGGCYDSGACGSTGNGCDYGSGSSNCGCNNTDLGCGCGNGWNGSLPATNQVAAGVGFGGGDVFQYGTLQPGVPKSKVILSAALGIPIM